MRRSKRAEIRKRAEARRERLAELRSQQQQGREQFAQQLQDNLNKPRGPVAQVEEALGEGAVWQGSLFRRVHAQARANAGAEFSAPAQVAVLLRRVARQAPRLVVPEYVAALFLVATLPWVRALDDWRPRGKGRDTLFRSLASHLLAAYPMPNVLWGALFEDDAVQLAPVVAHVAAGGSLHQAVQRGLLPVPLTRKMCHELLQTPGERFLEALRRAQIRALDGDRMLLSAWMSTGIGGRLHDRETEEFWVTVLRWLCRNPLLDRQQVAPLLDYIAHRRQEQADFSMKRRGALALLRAMREWHGELARARAIVGKTFPPSGFEPGSYRFRAKQDVPAKHWRVAEILCSKQLAAEGRTLKHCVYSYAWSIERGSSSIWSMTLDDERRITIEVRHQPARVVQARGKYNRAPTNEEHRILVRWARDNQLTIQTGV